MLDTHHDGTTRNIEPDSEGSFDNKAVRFKIVAQSNEDAPDINDGEIGADGHGDQHFPQIPPPSPDSHLPKVISNGKVGLTKLTLRLLFSMSFSWVL